MENARSEYPEELREIGEAALFLASLKCTEFDSKTVSSLEKLRKDINLGCRMKQSPRPRNRRIQRRRSTATVEDDDDIAAAAATTKPQTSDIQEDILQLILNYKPPANPPVPCLSDLILVCGKPFEKQLTESDVRGDQSRFAIHKADMNASVRPLLDKKDDLVKGIGVTTYDPNGKEYGMTLKVWTSKICILTSGWKIFCQDIGLKCVEDFVTLWPFRNRLTGGLCFAIISRRLPVSSLLNKRIQRKVRQSIND